MFLACSPLLTFVPVARSPTAGAPVARPTGPRMLLGRNKDETLEVRTIQEGKDDFQKFWGKGFSGGWGDGTAPLPMSTTAFINEMITTVTIAQASPNFQYSPVFAVGFETLVSYYAIEVRDEAARERMRVALAKALLTDPAQVKREADELLAAAEGADEE